MSNSTTIQTFREILTFDQFLEWYPEDGQYELIDGKVFEMPPTGQHEDVSEFLVENLTIRFS